MPTLDAYSAFYSRFTPSTAARLGHDSEYAENTILADIFISAETDLRRRGIPAETIERRFAPLAHVLSVYVRKLSAGTWTTSLTPDGQREDAPLPSLPDVVAEFARDVADEHASVLIDDQADDAADL